MKLVTVSLIAGLMAVGVANAADESKLAAAKGCMACHDVGAPKVGPIYKDVAAKYKGDKGALDRLANSVVKGTGPAGVGWQKAGKASLPFMPANATVKPEEAKKLVAWILSLK
jgi:cytochrome c